MSRGLERFSRFGSIALSENDGWALALATMVSPSGAPACELFLTRVAGLDCYTGEIAAWARALAAAYAATPACPRGGRRWRCPVEGYSPTWGHKAVSDGLTLALFDTAPPIIPRARELGIGTQPYLRIRDFIAGAAINAREQFADALRWALGERYDPELSRRWAAAVSIKRDSSEARATYGTSPQQARAAIARPNP